MSLPCHTHADPAVLHKAPPQLFTSLDNLFMVWPQGLAHSTERMNTTTYEFRDRKEV